MLKVEPNDITMTNSIKHIIFEAKNTIIKKFSSDINTVTELGPREFLIKKNQGLFAEPEELTFERL